MLNANKSANPWHQSAVAHVRGFEKAHALMNGFFMHEWKVLSKIHELNVEKTLNENRTYLTWNVKTNDVDARVVRDKHTHTQDNSPVHARRGIWKLAPTVYHSSNAQTTEHTGTW